MDPEDLECLTKKGALTVPAPDLRDACLRSFFQHVQPCFPILDLKSVQACVNESGPNSGKLSLLLFQAMMFVGSTWVDIRFLRKLGFLTRHAARKALHRKVRLLYDSDYEDDRICLVQCLILLTFWWEGPNENKDAWHWIGTALSVSRTIGLHQPCAEATFSPEIARFRKRLWWTILMRDTIASFGLSRAPRIRDEDHFVDMLEVEDFDVYDTDSDFMPGTVPLLVSQQRMFARLATEMARLCRILRRVLQLAYPESSSGQTASLYSSRQLTGLNKMTLPRKALDIEQLRICDQDLDRWRKEAPEGILHCRPMVEKFDPFDKAELAHRGLLSMLYHTTLMALHRPRILASSSVNIPTQTPAQVGQDQSRIVVRYAAIEITRIGMDFYEADLVSSLSATCLGCLLSAGISHIFDMTSTEVLIRSEGVQRLQQSKRLLQEFSDGHIAADWCTSILDKISTQVQMQVPAGEDNAPQRMCGAPARSIRVQHGDASYSTGGGHLAMAATLDNTRGKPTSSPETNGALTTGLGSLPGDIQFQGIDAFSQPSNPGPLVAGQPPGSPNEFTNILGLGDMWLDIAGIVNTNAEPDWIDSSTFWGN
ncbi:uncharacterized protein A1O9_11362 [Exophiala aquamarina CBS 119918]|uniref:Xylanolytic transcriptional activator regulatory domain-containing protein n=1 Tax=Exophiala aquamarina CBS 119918 TaxID=1182545 RepID=A0A072PAA4_9EURO|nr:uncharacterized protein A1O9_11362 [Exophiala aquamarina CBS 119918]KEF52520.1 hypothetical protein A1O9_11362 [Exophiala aquamarina CBS 119918]